MRPGRWLARVCALGLVVPVLAGAAAGKKRKQGPVVEQISLGSWYEIEAPRFSLYSDSDKKSVVALAKRVLSFERLAREITSIEHFAPRVPIRIIAFDVSDYLALFGGYSDGMMRPEGQRFTLVVKGGDTQTLLHEYTHYLIHNQGPRYPKWFDEGFAELISTAWFREDLAFVGVPPPSRMHALRQPKPLLPLRQVLGSRSYPKRVIYRFYAQSWLLTHYLHTAHAYGEPRLLDSMQRYIDLLHANTPWATAYDEAFEPTIAQLEERLARHRKRVVEETATLPMLSIEVGLPDTSTLTMRRVEPARMAEVLGDAHFSLAGTNRKAEAFYRESLELAPDRPTAQAALARFLAHQGRFKQARKLAESAASGSTELSAQLALGEVKTLEAQDADPPDPLLLEEAREIFRSIAQREPSHPAGYIGLADSYLDVEGEVGEGIAALERLATEVPALVPGLTLAKLYRAAGRRDDARRQLRLVVRWQGGDDADEARELLKELARDELDALDDDLETAEDPFREPAAD